MKILDVGSGYGYFTMEVARLNKNLDITGIDVSRKCVRKALRNIKTSGLLHRVAILEMDATNMDFPDQTFDMVVNFAGLEDIHMTRGKIGVRKTFFEVYRVLKPKSSFCLLTMPPDKMETNAQKLEVSLYSHICNATWMRSSEYDDLLKKTGFRILRKTNYYTGKKLTTKQAKVEIRYACKYVPKIYNVRTRSFKEIWGKFGEDIDKYGLGHLSKVVFVVAQKKG
jgi:ubiquinone/menaquinone biosynthesis C-methylase UbiE